MRRYYIDLGILLILSIIEFAVAAPVTIRQKPQSDIYVMHTIRHAKTKLGKRGDEDGLLSKLIGHSESHSPARPEEPPASQPSSSSQPSGPSDVPTNVEQPAPSTPKEPSQVPNPGHAPPVPDMNALNYLWLNHYGHRFSDDPLAAHFSWGPPPLGSAQGSKDVEQLAPSIHNEASQVGNPGHAPPVPDNNALNDLWLGYGFPHETVAAHSSSDAPPLGFAHDWPAGGWMHFDQSVPSIRNDLLRLPGTGYVPPAPGNDALKNTLWDPGMDALNDLWLNHYGHSFSDDPLAAHLLWGAPPSGSAHAPPVPDNKALSNLWLGLYGHRFPDESVAAHPSSSTPPSGSAHDWPASGWMHFGQPVTYVRNDLLQLAGTGHVPSAPVWPNLYGGRFPGDSLAAHSPSGFAQGSKDVEQPASSIHDEPSQVGDPGHAPSVPGMDALNDLWVNHYGHSFSDDPLAGLVTSLLNT